MLMVMEHKSGVMNRCTATQASFTENILMFNMHLFPPAEILQPWIQFRRPLLHPAGYLFNIPVVFFVAVATPHDLSRKVELVSACCWKDFVAAPRPLVIPAAGNLLRFDG